ncbi:unnamed protein product, partial [Prunus brigantina]
TPNHNFLDQRQARSGLVLTTSRAERPARIGRVSTPSRAERQARSGLVLTTSRAERPARIGRVSTPSRAERQACSGLVLTTSRAERQARIGRVSTPSRAERQARSGLVLTTSRAERQARIGRVWFSPPLVPNGRRAPTRSSCRSLPIFKPTPWLEDLGDYMITTGLQTTDARSRVRMPELRDKQVPNQEVPPRSET